MNVNVKLSFTNEQLNAIKRRLTGKDIKALATRAEINELVADLLRPYLTPPKLSEQLTSFPVGMTNVPPHRPQPPPFAKQNQAELDFSPDEESHADCCKAVELLTSRCNRLQHRLDTGRS